MKAPNEVIGETIGRVSDIIWWNRGLTQLTNRDWFTNGSEFTSHLVRGKGPFIEYVRPSAKHTETFSQFCGRLGIDDRLADAFTSLMFHGDPGGRLFKHQAEAIEELAAPAQRDVILSVPTATGKTESFLLPILNYCATAGVKGLKAILVYPLKTLEVDQLNRIIRALDVFNGNANGDDRIQVGIWDGDTPESVGTDESEDAISEGSPIRGIVCPACGDKLRIGRDNGLRCEADQRDFYWIKVTRKTIRQAARRLDLLITNPESLDFLMIARDAETKSLLGEVPDSGHVKYIVFDEAHVWRGISGSHIRLLIQRLRHFYRKNNPKIILVSATIGDPKGFARALLGSEGFRAIGFSPDTLVEPKTYDFSRVTPCTFRDVCESVLRLLSPEGLELPARYPNLRPALQMASALHLVSDGEQLSLTKGGKRVAELMDVGSLPVEDALDRAVSNLSNSLEFIEFWQKHLEEFLPEVYALANAFKAGESPIVFREAQSLSKMIMASGSSSLTREQADDILACLLSFGRSANLLLDKYHVFLKPISEIQWCSRDRLLCSDFVCPRCGERTRSLQFCPQCHHPYVRTVEQDDSLENHEKEDADEGEEPPVASFLPIESLLKTGPPGSGAINCIQCGEPLLSDEMEDPWVHYTTFISYMMSGLCREGGCQKVLVFSDGRISSESIAQRLVDLDYSLVAQQLYVSRLLSCEGRRKPSREIMFEVSRDLKEYYTRFMEESVTAEGSRTLVRAFFESNVRPKAFTEQLHQLFNFSIVTAIDAYERLPSTRDLILAQELLRIFVVERRGFTIQRVKLRGFTWRKLVARISGRLKWKPADIERRLPIVVRALIDAHAIEVVHPDAVRSMVDEGIQRAGGPDPHKTQEAVESHLKAAGAELRGSLGADVVPSDPLACMLAAPDYRSHEQFVMGLSPENVICRQCHAVWPARDRDVTSCPRCDGAVAYGSRLEGSHPTGIITTPDDLERPLDHWGKDIVKVALSSAGPTISHVVTWVHRAGISTDIRGAIEEGFRRSVPTINVVSSTPTLELGVDIGSLDAVVQVGMPPTLTNYVQRSGRTGRARGRPSYVFTVMRNEHSVDMYYFNDLDSYFKALKPIPVPNPSDYLPVQAPHVVTEVCAYLSRALPADDYRKLFSVDNVHDLGNFSREVVNRLRGIAQLATRDNVGYAPGVRKHIREVFGDLKAFDEAFAPAGPLSLNRKASETFEKLSRLQQATQRMQFGYTEQNKTLGSWLSLMGYIAAYRGIGGNPVPLALSGPQTSQIEVKTEDRIVAEAFPGENDGNGAIFQVETVRFVVRHATGGPKALLSTTICRNYEGCPLPCLPYPVELVTCPLCGDPLDKVTVYNIDQVSPALARRLTYITSPVIAATSHITEELQPAEDCGLGALPFKARLGRVHNVVFTPAFRRSKSGRAAGRYCSSEAEIRLPSPVSDTPPEEFDVKQWLENPSATPKAPIGYEEFTEGVEMAFSRTGVTERIGDKEEDLVVACVSMAQALKRGVSLVAQTEMSDFNVYWNLDEKEVRFFICDGRSGASGVSRLVMRDILRKPSQLELLIRETVHCPADCPKFCDSCLLLERTPPIYIDNGLLNRQLLGKLLGV